MKKIAVINDLSGIGKCSLTAAIPVISAMGVQAVPLPTAILSSQTGYASYFMDDYTSHIGQIAREWQKLGFVPDGIYTGFLAGEQQADKILEFLDMFCREETQVLVDPVMGDNGQAFGFCTEAFLEKMRLLSGRAWILTPNLTEAMLLLYGKEGMERRYESLEGLSKAVLQADVEMLGQAIRDRFLIRALVITGVNYEDGDGTEKIGNLVLEKGRSCWVEASRMGGSYSGTGDLFASVLCAGMAKGWSVEQSAQKAADFLAHAIADTVQEETDRNEGVCFEPHLHRLWTL